MGKRSLRDYAAGIEVDGVTLTQADVDDLVERKRVEKSQKVMREEMAAMTERVPSRAGDAVDDLVGKSVSAPAVEALALKIIHDVNPDLQLGFSQWRAVQSLVEAGIYAGAQNARQLTR